MNNFFFLQSASDFWGTHFGALPDICLWYATNMWGKKKISFLAWILFVCILFRVHDMV